LAAGSKAAIVVNPEDPEAAVAEIRRRADDPRFAQVQLGTRAVEPLGRRRYWPVYAAAEETGFPVGFHVGGPAAFPPSAGGWPSHYVEYLQVVGQTGPALLASLVPVPAAGRRRRPVEIWAASAAAGWQG
jgi:hypothetical protein